MDSEAHIEAFHGGCDLLTAKLPDLELTKLANLREKFLKVVTFASDYDFEDVKCNGYRIAIYIISVLVQDCANSTGKQPNREEKTLKFANWYLDIIIDLQRISPEGIEATEPLYGFENVLATYRQLKPELELIVNDKSWLIYDPDYHTMYKSVAISTQFMTPKSIFDFVKKLLSVSYRRSALIDMLHDVNYMSFLNYVRRATALSSVVSNLTVKYLFYQDVARRDVQITAESLIQFRVQGPKLDLVLNQSAPLNQRGMRLRVLNLKGSANNNNTRNVLFYVYGGSFMVGSPENVEPMLCEYARIFGPETVIIVPEYRLAPENRFPRAQQDIMDAYTWLTTTKKSELIQVLGFDIGSIVVAGDSAGACLAAATILGVADARRDWPEEGHSLPYLPAAFVSVIGAFKMNGFYPSLLISSMDFVLSTWNMCYSAPSICAPNEQNVIPPMYIPGEEFMERKDVQEALQQLSSPYLSPLDYKCFENLEGIKLSVITSSTCYFADHSICLAKKWPGKVSLRVLDRQPHIFPGMALGLQKSLDNVRICGREIFRVLSSS